MTITIDDDLLSQIDDLARRRGYPSRSEAVRELLRDAAGREAMASGDSHCLATLTYLYNHHVRDLSERVNSAQHDHHDLSVATTHIHLDHDNCLEVAVLRGPVGRVQSLADQLTAQRGVYHSSLHIIPAPVAAPVDHNHAHARKSKGAA